ncbi:MAG TPA: dienelactone hydrolase family protein [Phenylobacterium sp.]|nr:dienelactone hydrolase family protein [Phenylobacterium sp.]
MRALYLGLAALLATSGGAAAAEQACHVGLYRFEDGQVIDVSFTAQDKLRWQRIDGRTGVIQPAEGAARISHGGWTDEADGVRISLPPCTERAITVDGQVARKVDFEVTDTRFKGAGGIELAGRLVLPKGAGKVPIVVIGHGSEDTSALKLYDEQRLYPSQGVGAFLFDKRGTGGSGGKYSQDFELLAQDVAAAVAEARRLAGARAGRVGLEGASQGGWIIPLAATKTQVDFVLVDYGLTIDPWAENLAETVQDLEAKGWGPADVAKGREMGAAASNLVASKFGEAEMAAWDALRTKYQAEPWYKDLEGEFTGMLAPHAAPQAKAAALAHPIFHANTTWRHDSLGVLRRVKAPVLWIIAGSDTVAPPEQTEKDLETLIKEGRDIRAAVFPGTDHGIRQFTVKDGERAFSRYADGYTALRIDWIKGAPLKAVYGQATFIGR